MKKLWTPAPFTNGVKHYTLPAPESKQWRAASVHSICEVKNHRFKLTSWVMPLSVTSTNPNRDKLFRLPQHLADAIRPSPASVMQDPHLLKWLQHDAQTGIRTPEELLSLKNNDGHLIFHTQPAPYAITTSLVPRMPCTNASLLPTSMMHATSSAHDASAKRPSYSQKSPDVVLKLLVKDPVGNQYPIHQTPNPKVLPVFPTHPPSLPPWLTHNVGQVRMSPRTATLNRGNVGT